MSARAERFRLPKELQYAAAAVGGAGALVPAALVSEDEVIDGKLAQGNVSALGAFTFVEGAILLVAVAVCFLVWAALAPEGLPPAGRRRRGDHARGRAGASLLIVFRMFDQPDDAGIQWGLFGAFVAAGALIAAGARLRAVHAPEPPNPAADDAGWVHAAAPRARRPGPPAARRHRGDRDAARPSGVGGRRPDHPPGRSAHDAAAADASEAPTRRERRDETTERLWEDEPPR